MAHLVLKTEYTVTFTQEEFRLVGFALDRDLHSLDRKAARQLNVHLQQMRRQRAKFSYNVSVDAEASASKTCQPEDNE